MKKNLISIITPVHNLEKYIQQTIESVQNQSIEKWEMILIDDCSTDNSVNIIKDFIKTDSRIKLIQNVNNSGPAITRNKGIKAAKGNYLTFLDGDDIWFPDFLEISLETCQKKNYEFVFSSYKRWDENLNPYISDFIVPDKVNYQDVLKSCPISCLTAFIDISRIGKFYMPVMDKRQDWGLWLSILKHVNYANGIKKPLAAYRMRKDSVSRSKIDLIPYVWKVYREVEGINRLRSFYLLSHWALNGFLKYYVNR